MEIDPLNYGLSTRVKLEDLGDKRLGIRKVIKSRIILKDAKKIAEMGRQIKNVDSNFELSLICTRNICSKSITYLQKENIEIIFVD